MKSIRSKDTKVEWKLRRSLFARGIRYRKNYRNAPGSPDVAIIWAKLAIFVDGDFWHGNSWRLRGLNSLSEQFPTNTEYWVNKIERNMSRDKAVTARLEGEGWTVIRFWETDVLENTDQCVEKVIKTLQKKVSQTDCY